MNVWYSERQEYGQGLINSHISYCTYACNLKNFVKLFCQPLAVWHSQTSSKYLWIEILKIFSIPFPQIIIVWSTCRPNLEFVLFKRKILNPQKFNSSKISCSHYLRLATITDVASTKLPYGGFILRGENFEVFADFASSTKFKPQKI